METVYIEPKHYYGARTNLKRLVEKTVKQKYKSKYDRTLGHVKRVEVGEIANEQITDDGTAIAISIYAKVEWDLPKEGDRYRGKVITSKQSLCWIETLTGIKACIRVSDLKLDSIVEFEVVNTRYTNRGWICSAKLV